MEPKTKHLEGCKRVFKNYDKDCPRCQELANGAKPRAGWNDWKKAMEARTLEAIRHHDFEACQKKNIVCTHFEW